MLKFCSYDQVSSSDINLFRFWTYSCSVQSVLIMLHPCRVFKYNCNGKYSKLLHNASLFYIDADFPPCLITVVKHFYVKMLIFYICHSKGKYDMLLKPLLTSIFKRTDAQTKIFTDYLHDKFGCVFLKMLSPKRMSDRIYHNNFVRT
jgi:hypothetical protein